MQFNDPFDCDPNLIDFSKVPYERCKTWTSDIIESLAFDQYRKNREDVWVCCLSKVFDSLLMWAYYNNHRGVCIGLNMEKVAKYFDASLGQIVDKHAHEVQYRDIIEKPDYFQNEEDFFVTNGLTGFNLLVRSYSFPSYSIVMVDNNPRFLFFLPPHNQVQAKYSTF